SALQTLWPLLTTIPVLIVLVGVVIHRTLTPVRHLGAMLDEASSAMPVVLPTRGVPRELLPFIASINALMGRARDAQRRQQRFIADEAHELSNQLAALSLQAGHLSGPSSHSTAA